jgi:hypothetical protein
MISDTVSHGGAGRPLEDEKGEHLRRLARFALVDDVPDPWGFGSRDDGSASTVPGEFQDE